MEQESMTHTPEKKQAAEAACERQDVGFNRKRLQNSHYKYVHRTKGKRDYWSKGRYDDSVALQEDISEEIKMVKKKKKSKWKSWSLKI